MKRNLLSAFAGYCVGALAVAVVIGWLEAGG